jgi:threonine dehydrogenase-like Zn-dependent dehydrogenase
MRALVIDKTAASPVAVRTDRAMAQPGKGESLIRVRVAGICGTDLEQTRGYMDYTGVPGHEFVGEVVQSASVGLLGKRVVGEINAACGQCEWCRADLGRHCPNRTVLGILGRDGAFADYLCLPDCNLTPLPDSLPDEVAVFTEPLAAGFEIFEQTHIEPGERIAILGDGRLGAMVGLALTSRDLRPVIGGHHDNRMRLLASLGLVAVQEHTLRPGYDVVVDCTGSAAGLARCLELVRPRGRIILKSTVAGNDRVNLAAIVVNEIEVLGSRCGRFAPALAALESGAFDPRSLITDVFALDDAPAALRRAAEPSAFKVLLRVR